MADADDDHGGSGEEDEKKKKGTKRKARKGPKKALTAYVFFCNEKRSDVKTNNPDATFGEIGKKLGQMWKEVTDSEKKKYKKMQEEDKKRYEKEKSEMPEGEDGGDEEDRGKKKRKTAKSKKDPNEPKKAKSAYMFFGDDERKKIKESDPNMQFGDVNKLIGERWKELSDEDKKPYQEKYAEAKSAADKAKADWVAEHGEPEKRPRKKKAGKGKKKKKDDDDEGDDGAGSEEEGKKKKKPAAAAAAASAAADDADADGDD